MWVYLACSGAGVGVGGNHCIYMSALGYSSQGSSVTSLLSIAHSPTQPFLNSASTSETKCHLWSRGGDPWLPLQFSAFRLFVNLWFPVAFKKYVFVCLSSFSSSPFPSIVGGRDGLLQASVFQSDVELSLRHWKPFEGRGVNRCRGRLVWWRRQDVWNWELRGKGRIWKEGNRSW